MADSAFPPVMLRFGTVAHVSGTVAQVRFPGSAATSPVTCVGGVPTAGSKIVVFATRERKYWLGSTAGSTHAGTLATFTLAAPLTATVGTDVQVSGWTQTSNDGPIVVMSGGTFVFGGFGTGRWQITYRLGVSPGSAGHSTHAATGAALAVQPRVGKWLSTSYTSPLEGQRRAAVTDTCTVSGTFVTNTVTPDNDTLFLLATAYGSDVTINNATIQMLRIR